MAEGGLRRREPACLSGAGIGRQVLNKRRMAAWEAGWIVSSRNWSRQCW
jgi:hypothetical protein